MPPKKQSRTAGLLQFFAKQQQERIQNQQTSTNHDDSCQILFDAKTAETPKNATKWGESLENAAKTSGSSTTGRDWQNPFSVQVGRRKESRKEVDLISHGFDNQGNGNALFFPIHEPIREFEKTLVKCAATSNCCIALPATAPSSASRISAITVFNFLKWFPRCRVLLVGESDISSLRELGLESQTTRLTTVTQFKKTAAGRILACATPQCALRIVESAEAREFLDEIRLVVLELKPNECCSKYKPILNALTVKDVFFRCIVLTTATSNASRRTASITKRQLMITNLQLSDWIEQSDTDFAFRSANIPSGAEVKTWKLEDASSEELKEIVINYEEFCAEKIDSLARDFIVPSKNLKNLIWICWKSIKTSTSIPPEKLEKLELAELLVTTYKILIIDGVEAARGFVKKQSKQSEICRSILEIFGGFSEFPAKFQILSNAIEAFLKMDTHVRGVVLCRDAQQAAEIQNFLKLQINSVAHPHFIQIVEEGGGLNFWPLSRISTVFHDRKTPKILILPVKLRDFIGYSDSLPLNEVTFVASVSRETIFNFRRFNGAYLLILNDPLEKLRKEDGRLIVDDGKFAKKEAKNLKIGAVERYDFKFEISRLRIDVSHFQTQFFYPKRVFDEFAEISRLGRTHIEMTSKEHAELFRRLKNPDFSVFQRRKRKLCVIQMEDVKKRPLEVEAMDEEQVFWNQDLQYLGEVKSSKQSEKLTKYLKSGTLSWVVSGEKRRYQYVNEISRERRVAHLNRLLESLDAHFDGGATD